MDPSNKQVRYDSANWFARVEMDKEIEPVEAKPLDTLRLVDPVVKICKKDASPLRLIQDRMRDPENMLDLHQLKSKPQGRLAQLFRGSC